MPAARPGRRRARLTLKRLDPWSVLKTTFIYALAVFVIIMVAGSSLYGLLDAMGVFRSLKTFLGTVGASGHVTSYFSFGRVFLYMLIMGVVSVVLLSALGTLGAFLYNICADLAGGIEITLTETD